MSVPSRALVEGGLDPRGVSPLSSRWMSFIDPSAAKVELGFTHEPLAEVMAGVVAAFVDSPPAETHPGYARRATEIELAERVG